MVERLREAIQANSVTYELRHRKGCRYWYGKHVNIGLT